MCPHGVDLLSKQRAPKWEVHASQVLGKGMDGTLRLATRVGKSSPVYAVKMVPTSNERTRRRALHEASVLKALNHPNIRCLVDCFEEKEHIHMVLEYIDGCDLADYILKNGAVEEMLALTIMQQMLEALRYCHAQELPVIHGDVKPENIVLSMRTDKIGAKLIDFGLAMRGHRCKVHGKITVGTPAYISPEANTTRVRTPASDVWALGVVLNAMLTKTFVPAEVRAGHKPFAVKSSAQMSVQASQMLAGLLQLDPHQRLTASEAVKHPWFHSPLLFTPVSLSERNVRKAGHKICNRRLSKARALVLAVETFKTFDEDSCPIPSESTYAPSTPGGSDKFIEGLENE